MAGTRTKRSVASAIALLGVLAGLGCCSEESQQTAREKAQSDREAKAAAASVSVLPPGTEEAWLAYVDTRIATTMKREGSAVQVNPFGFDGFIMYISLNTPYKITCIYGSIIVYFIDGTGSSGVEGHDDKVDYVVISGLDSMKIGEPPLGVDPTSIAAIKLNETLCRKVSDRMQAIMSLDK